MRISDWSSDVCSSDLPRPRGRRIDDAKVEMRIERGKIGINVSQRARIVGIVFAAHAVRIDREAGKAGRRNIVRLEQRLTRAKALEVGEGIGRSEEHTSELQLLMRISYDVLCLKKKRH